MEGYNYDISNELKNFDIFGYPLNPLNYATTENALLEAMAAGMPIVVMNQGTEKYIIEDEKTGLLSGDIEDYADNVIRLAKSEKLRKKCGENARSTVFEKYDLKKNVSNFQDAVQRVMAEPKRVVNFKKVIGNMPEDWICSAMNPIDRKLYDEGRIDELPDIFREENKSSLKHFARYYPEINIIGKC